VHQNTVRAGGRLHKRLTVQKPSTATNDDGVKSSQELLPKYTEQERQLTCPEGVCVQAVFQQPELRGMSARARPRVTLRMVLVLFAELFFLLLWISIIFCARPC